MTDLKTRFQSLDTLRVPGTWPEIEARAQAKERHVTRPLFWVLIGVAVMVALVVGGAVLVGSGTVRLTMTTPSATPATTALTGPRGAPTTDPQTPRPAGWVAVGSMVEARINHTATLLSDGRVLVAGGDNGTTQLASAELFDPATGSWTPTGSMIPAAPRPPETSTRIYHTATRLLDGTVLVIGFQPGQPYRAAAELYDPGSGTWRSTGEPESGLYDGMTATRLFDGNVLLAYGSQAQIYDAGTGSWRTTGPMINSRSQHAAALLPNGKVLVVGGTQDNRSWASAEVYDPNTGTWSATGSLAEGRFHLGATLLVDGTVLVAGGLVNPFEGPREVLSAERYDPISGTWATTGNMIEQGFSGATFTLLLDGTVLAVGQANTAELYDPVSGTWTNIVDPTGPTLRSATARLADGTVLVAGGYWNNDPAGNQIPVTSAEVYEPVSGN